MSLKSPRANESTDGINQTGDFNMQEIIMQRVFLKKKKKIPPLLPPPPKKEKKKHLDKQ